MAIIRSGAARALPLFRKSVYALAVAAAFGAPPVLATPGVTIGDPLTAEIQVNTTTSGAQIPAGVAMNAAGGFVVTWKSVAQDGDGLGAYARVFLPDGTPATASEIAVNTTTTGDQFPVGVAMDAAGDYVVVWNSYGQDGSAYGAFARVFFAGGTSTSEIPVNSTTFHFQNPAGVAMDTAGDFVVTWTSYLQDGDGYGAYARVFHADGTPATPEIQVNSTTASHQIAAGVAMNDHGDFAVTWKSIYQDGDRLGAFVRAFHADGTPATSEIQVNITTTNQERPAGVAMDAAGDFVVTWVSVGQDDVGSAGAYARVFHADGTAATTDIRVNSTTSDHQEAKGVVMDAAGDFVVTWSSISQDGSGYGAYAREFKFDGTPVTGEIQVNTTTDGKQNPKGVAMNADGDFTVTWSSKYQDGDDDGVFARKFAGIRPIDLSLTQSASANPVAINSSGGLTYSLTAHNNSTTNVASNLVLAETLATGLTFNSFSSADPWACTTVAQVVTCNLASLAATATSTVDLTLDSGATPGSVKTTGNVSALNSDPVPGNNNKNITTLLCDPAAAGNIAFGSNSFAATEGVAVTITVNRSSTSCSNTSVHYSTVSGGSAPASDFTATSGDFTWLPLDANKKTFVVPISNDSVYTGNRTVNLQLSSPSSNATLTKATSVINIKDDELPLTIGLTTTDQTVSEEGGVATVTATLSGVRNKDTVVPLIVTGTAAKTKDYTLSGASITILAGNTSNSVTLTGLHDVLDEPDETAIVKMGTVTGVAASGTTTNTITFSDDDATPTISFDAASSARAESKANSVNLVLSAASGQNVTVTVSSTGGSAANGADYTINGAGTVTIPAGATTATAVTIINDTAHESSETATFQIDGATNATPSGIQSTTLTITDNDP